MVRKTDDARPPGARVGRSERGDALRSAALLPLAVLLAVVMSCVLAGTARADTPVMPQVSGGDQPAIGSTLSTTPVYPGDTIDWDTCDASGNLLPSTQMPNVVGTGDTYTLAVSDATTYVCAYESNLLLGNVESVPVGPVSGTVDGPTLGAAGQTVTQGQTLTVAPGQWYGATSVTDVWEDCNAAGTGCVPVVSGATGGSYTVTRSDAGDTIEVLETAAPSNGAATQAMTAPSDAVVGTMPSNTTAPTVAGAPAVGQILTATSGAWTNFPSSYVYSWLRCSTGACAAIPGAASQTYSPTAADVGDVLEVDVSASVPGATSAPFPSFPTAPVTATAGTGVTVSGSPAPQPHLRKRHRHMSSTMRWTFRYFPTYTQIVELAVENPTLGSKITMRCTGRGCPFKERRQTVARPKGCRAHGSHRCRVPRRVDLTSSFGGQDLAAGAAVTVLIKRSGYIGQDYRFEIRARKQPAVRIGCLEPGSSRVRTSCR